MNKPVFIISLGWKLSNGNKWTGRTCACRCKLQNAAGQERMTQISMAFGCTYSCPYSSYCQFCHFLALELVMTRLPHQGWRPQLGTQLAFSSGPTLSFHAFPILFPRNCSHQTRLAAIPQISPVGSACVCTTPFLSLLGVRHEGQCSVCSRVDPSFTSCCVT